MSYFFFAVLLVGLYPALWLALTPAPRLPARLGPAWLLGLLAGALLGSQFPAGQWPLLALHLTGLMLPLLYLLLQWRAPGRGLLPFALLLAALAGLWFVRDPRIQNFTATAVVNSSLLLNLGALLGGLLITGLLAWCARALVTALPGLRWPLLGLLLAGYLLPLSGALLLSLIKLQILPMQGSLLSYIAKSMDLSERLPYWALLLLAALALAALRLWWWPRRQALGLSAPGNDRRKALAASRQARRWCVGLLALLPLALLPALYWHLVASQPPGLSAAQPVALNAQDEVRIPVSQVRDGNLHRFAWVNDEGKVIRFFVINRYPDQLKLGVVFDACLLCGDQGYVQEGNQVICVACGVHIFIPSIGKAGGCNPVPIEGWRLEGEGAAEALVLPASALQPGATLFSAVVARQVTDPVSGETLSNLDAPHRTTVGDHTYFFTQQAHLDAFEADPAAYLKQEAP
ncbi:Fe-S-containing protein [Pseudaeromonas paramecii]|uniref:Membrane iron-sulfur containing protein FtrD-like domain-containing protein n=1 Tax=Pseudaeromonas paramecii TaxID=2138166 RepID=A0ABP8QAZ3_9GAMM